MKIPSLEPIQERLLCKLVEREWRALPGYRVGFVFRPLPGSQLGVIDGPGAEGTALYRDLLALTEAGVIQPLSWDAGRIQHFTIDSLGYAYFSHQMRQSRPPAEEIDDAALDYLDGSAFRRRHARAWQHWHNAERILRNPDPAPCLGEIAQQCGEAIRAFSHSMTALYAVSAIEATANPADRIHAVLTSQSGLPPDGIDALVAYVAQVWRASQCRWDGNSLLGRLIKVEDAWRLVVQTAIVLTEVDQLMHRPAVYTSWRQRVADEGIANSDLTSGTSTALCRASITRWQGVQVMIRISHQYILLPDGGLGSVRGTFMIAEVGPTSGRFTLLTRQAVRRYRARSGSLVRDGIGQLTGARIQLKPLVHDTALEELNLLEIVPRHAITLGFEPGSLAAQLIVVDPLDPVRTLQVEVTIQITHMEHHGCIHHARREDAPHVPPFAHQGVGAQESRDTGDNGCRSLDALSRHRERKR